MKSKFEGTTKIFRKDFNDRAVYSTSIGKKRQDGEWDNAYIGVQFKRGTDIHDGTKIDIINGWLTFYLNKEGKPVWQIFVSEFETESQLPEGFAVLDDSECPF